MTVTIAVVAITAILAMIAVAIIAVIIIAEALVAWIVDENKREGETSTCSISYFMLLVISQLSHHDLCC